MFADQRVMIFLENFLVKEGLFRHLSSTLGFRKVHVCSDSKDFEKNISNFQPDFIIIPSHSENIKMEKVIAYVDITCAAKIIVLGEALEKRECEKLKELGVLGFLLNTSNDKEIGECFKKVRQNHTFICKGFFFENHINPSSNIFSDLNISDREIEIIKLIAQGLINKEIADRLFLSTHTVNTHRKNIMQKLGINNTAGIVLFAVKEKIVSPNEFLFN